MGNFGIWILFSMTIKKNVKSLCKMCLTVEWKHSFCLSFTPALFLPASRLLLLLLALCSPLSCHSSHRTKCMLDNALSFPLWISLLCSFISVSSVILFWVMLAESRRVSKRAERLSQSLVIWEPEWLLCSLIQLFSTLMELALMF